MTSSFVKVDGLFKNFNSTNGEIEILKNISFDLGFNSTLSLVGPSGSGKTTLLSLLAGLDLPTQGKILFTDEPSVKPLKETSNTNHSVTDITQLSEKKLSQFRSEKIGIVFQQFHLMPHLNALENVMLPLEIRQTEQIREKAEDALASVGLAKRLQHTPSQLSGGECQRVAIARALVARPQLLLADEPSGNLDHETGKQVMDLLFKIQEERKMSLILVTHDLELAKMCEKQIHIIGGELQ